MQRAFTVAAGVGPLCLRHDFRAVTDDPIDGAYGPDQSDNASDGAWGPDQSDAFRWCRRWRTRRPDIHDHQIDLSLLGDLHALSAILCRGSFKLLVQRKLIRQRIAQLRIIVDNENLMGIRHQFIPP